MFWKKKRKNEHSEEKIREVCLELGDSWVAVDGLRVISIGFFGENGRLNIDRDEATALKLFVNEDTGEAKLYLHSRFVKEKGNCDHC